MKAYKAKATSKLESAEKLTMLDGPKNGCATIQAIFYSSDNPSRSLYLYDRDGDMISFPLPGQLEKKATAIQPVTVSLPLFFMDEDGGSGNQIIVFGQME